MKASISTCVQTIVTNKMVCTTRNLSFRLLWNNEPKCTIVREWDGVVSVIINGSKYQFHKYSLEFQERFMGVLNVLTYRTESGGWDLHQPDGTVLYDVNVAYIIHVIMSYTC